MFFSLFDNFSGRLKCFPARQDLLNTSKRNGKRENKIGWIMLYKIFRQRIAIR